MTEKQKSLVGGVSILGAAGLICKLVGVLYRIPLAALIAPMGMAIYHKVFPAYNLLLTVSSAGIPVAISRMVSHYVTKGEHKNAARIFRMALYMLTALGLISTVLLMALAPVISGIQGTPSAAAGYLCIAPSLFFVCVMSAYRGYLQGRRHMTPTAVSQLIEQVGKVAIALPLAALGRYHSEAMGAAGALLGSTIGEGAALIYMMVQKKKHDPEIQQLQQENVELLQGKTVAKRLVTVAIPITLGACIVPLAGFVDSIMLTNLMVGAGMEQTAADILYGAYAGPVLTLINVPTALAMAMSTNLVPSIASGLARGDREVLKKETDTGLRMAAVIGFPCSVGMSILAEPILHICYRGSYDTAQLAVASELLQISSLTIVLFTMVQATSGILQGMGKQKIPMYTLLAGVLMKIMLNYTLVRVPGMNIHGAPWASLLCYTVSMVPNLYYVCKYTGYRFDWKGIVLKPLSCTLLMGLAVGMVWHFLFGASAELNRLVLMAGAGLCVMLGILIYGILILKLRAVRKEELPGKIRRLLK